MLSAQHIAAVKTAVMICNDLELKKEILCAPGSDYDINKKADQYDRKELWNEIVERKAVVKLENLQLPKQLQEKLIGLILPVGMRMLTWAEYHEGTLLLSREFSVNFLNSSFFAPQGIIDNKKAAEALIEDGSLSIQQKYKLACLYCLTKSIRTLCSKMAKEEFYDTENPQRIKQPELIKFWSYYLMGEIDKLKGEKPLNQYRLEKAVESGSKAAVEYSLVKTNFSRKKNAIADAAVEAVRCRVRCEGLRLYPEEDWIVFRDQRYKDSEESWVPNDYYMDILCLLLSKMEEDQQIEFLKKDIEGDHYGREFFQDNRRSRVLEYFLNWPYQDYFMKTANLMWEFLPERNYAVLLQMICDKIEPRKEENLKYGEEKSYDYRSLLKEFWCQSPERYKRYFFSNQEVVYIIYGRVGYRVKACVGLLIKLLSLRNFVYEDRENIQLILKSAIGEEKEIILSSEEWRKFCIGLMKEEKWEILDAFVLDCFLSKEEERKFKKELRFTKEAQHVCIDFIKNDKWNAAESFIKRSSLAKEDINKLKKEMIYSENGRNACVGLISDDKKLETVDKFIRWCFSSEEKVREFKKELIFSDHGIDKCADLIEAGQLQIVSKFINFCLASEKDVRDLKKQVAYRYGSLVCEGLISDKGEYILDHSRYDVTGNWIKFKDVKWEKVDKFLTWCFSSSEEEISDFKKNKLLQVSGKEIHFNLIESNRWEEAERFFAWLGLSAEETKELKKGTLFCYGPALTMFSELMYSEGDEEFVNNVSKQEEIKQLLRWYLTDKDTVLEFKDKFKGQYGEEVTENQRAMFENFDFIIQQYLRDLDEEQNESKEEI